MEDFKSQFPTNNLHLLHKYDTIFSADSIEWCPHEPFKHFFVCANYQLAEDDSEGKSDKPRERSGRVLLFSISNTGLELHETIDTSAVLDQKWCHNIIEGNSYLAVANATKEVQLYRLDGELKQLKLVASFKLDGDESETLMLSLDWSTGLHGCNQPEIVCSDSKGNVHLLQFKSDDLVFLKSWHGHEYEAWIAAFYYWDTNIIFTGGDDSYFLKFDKRIGDEAVSKSRAHEAGVTCIHSNKSKEFLVATGSYDSNIRFWDIRNLRRPTETIRMPGTLWRLKWDPFTQENLLAACMLGGVHVLNHKKVEIIESFYEHEKIAYGADWCHLQPERVNGFEGEGDVIIGTCSFYDHLMCISKISIGE